MGNEITEVKEDLSEDDIKDFEESQEIETEETPKVIEEESTVEIPEKETSATVIKDVDGETPRERALRLELTRVRRQSREKEQKEISNNIPVEENIDSDEELRSQGYDDDQIAGLKKTFSIMAKSQGYVKKDDSYKGMVDETLNNFVDEHSEYASENDKDDLYWDKFKSILNSDYNLNGKNSKQIKSVFERVDRDVKEELGDKELTKDKIEAQKRKISDVSHAASTSSKETVETKKAVSAGNKTFISSGHPGLVFKGFEEDEMEDILK